MGLVDYCPVGLSGLTIALFVLIIGLPFAKGALLHVTTRLLKFRTTSFWRSFISVLIGLGAMMLVRVVVGLSFIPFGDENADVSLLAGPLIVLASNAIIPVAEVVAVVLLLKESALKTIVAVVLVNIFTLVLFVAFTFLLLPFVM